MGDSGKDHGSRPPSELIQGTSHVLLRFRVTTASWERQRKLGHGLCSLRKVRHTECDGQDRVGPDCKRLTNAPVCGRDSWPPLCLEKLSCEVGSHLHFEADDLSLVFDEHLWFWVEGPKIWVSHVCRGPLRPRREAAHLCQDWGSGSVPDTPVSASSCPTLPLRSPQFS